MKLITRLSTDKNKKGQTKYYGLFRCPKCRKKIKLLMHNGLKQETCMKCRSPPNSAKKSIKQVRKMGLSMYIAVTAECRERNIKVGDKITNIRFDKVQDDK